MDDPLTTLYAALKAQWGGAIVPAVADIRFSTGWYDKDIVTPQIIVTEVSTLDEPFELGYGTVRVNAVYAINIWVTVIRATDAGPQLAKEYLWAMRQEVKRIVKANLTGLTDIVLLVLNESGQALNEPDATPPLLRFQQFVAVIYDL